MSQLRGIHHSIRHVCRILIRCFPTLAHAWLACYPSFPSTDRYSPARTSSNIQFHSSRQLDSNEMLPDLAGAWLVCYPYLSSTESYSAPQALSYIPFTLSSLLDSNETLADWIRPLAIELPYPLVSSPHRAPVVTDPSL